MTICKNADETLENDRPTIPTQLLSREATTGMHFEVNVKPINVGGWPDLC